MLCRDLLGFPSLLPSGFSQVQRLLNLLHKDIARRKFSHILCYLDACFVKLQEFNYCRDSVATICSSLKRSANCIIRRMLFSSNPLRPYEACNCRDTVATICRPYAARLDSSISWLIRLPMCQYIIVNSKLAVTATRLRASSIMWRKSAKSNWYLVSVFSKLQVVNSLFIVRKVIRRDSQWRNGRPDPC